MTCACWSAAAPPGAIAGAFNAPLTGAFYAFELVIGTYSLGTFAPVAVAAIVAVAVVHALGAAPFDLVLQVPSASRRSTTSRSWRLACSARLLGIAIMRGVTRDRGAVPQEPRAGLASAGHRRAGGRRCWR